MVEVVLAIIVTKCSSKRCKLPAVLDRDRWATVPLERAFLSFYWEVLDVMRAKGRKNVSILGGRGGGEDEGGRVRKEDMRVVTERTDRTTRHTHRYMLLIT